jgi:hypothetical protein
MTKMWNAFVINQTEFAGLLRKEFVVIETTMEKTDRYTTFLL